MKKYSIGEVSSRLGLSRDTLRFYEKKGIIQPEKQDNGYRAYTYEDIRKLLNVMFYRRLNFSLEDINRILYKNSFPSYRSMIQEKITEEKLQVEKHRQSLVQLTHLQQLYKNAEQCLGCYAIRPFKPHYQIEDSSSLDRAGISDLCSLYQEYRLMKRDVRQQGERLMIPRDTAEAMKLEKELEDQPVIRHERCVYTVIASKSPFLNPQTFLNAAKWAGKQGYTLSGTGYGGYLLSCAFEEKAKENQNQDPEEPVHYMELYLPVESRNQSFK
ncbi:MAG: MerR family transcriptional regulator [Lacrimispora sp.]